MTTGYRIASGTDFDGVFDPYVQGAIPANTGFRTSDGVDLAGRYAPITYGTAAAVTGYRLSGGSDVNTLWAAFGTANYPIAINGQTYTAAYNIPNATSGYALIGFRIVTGNTWQVYESLNGASPVVLASGSVPGTSATVQFTFGSYTVGAGQVDAGGTTSNGAATPTALSSNPVAYYQTATATSTSGSRGRNYIFTVDFFNGASSRISHSVCNLVGDTEGSV